LTVDGGMHAEMAAGTALVQLPRKACLLVGESDACPFPTFVDSALWDTLKGDEQQGIVRLALCLLHEKSLGAASAFAPYIQQLPQEFYTLDSFNVKETKELQYTPVCAEANNGCVEPCLCMESKPRRCSRDPSRSNPTLLPNPNPNPTTLGRFLSGSVRTAASLPRTASVVCMPPASGPSMSPSP
jgi:hypothetical protein